MDSAAYVSPRPHVRPAPAAMSIPSTVPPFAPEIKRAIELELHAICSNAQFRTSQRNCAFLHYVIKETLEGRADEIKERILGKELFGRPISYDTGSDAVVRVRANEVRKRLLVYYESHFSQAGWRVHLPLRTYVPVFVPEDIPSADTTLTSADELAQAPAIAPTSILETPVEASISAPIPIQAAPDVATAAIPDEVPQVPAAVFALPFSRMVVPTLIALFLCAATFRWQAFSSTPYFDFWEALLSGHAGIALVLDADPADSRAVKTSDLEIIRPLLTTAAIFHASAEIDNSSAALAGKSNLLPVYITHHTPQNEATNAGYLTLVPASDHSAEQITIGSADTHSLDLAVHAISDSNLFPTSLEVAIRRHTPTRLRFADGQPVKAETLAAVEGPWHN